MSVYYHIQVLTLFILQLLFLEDLQFRVQTRSKVTKSYGAHAFKISDALVDEKLGLVVSYAGRTATIPVLEKFKILIDFALWAQKAIATKWVYINKKDKRGVVGLKPLGSFSLCPLTGISIVLSDGLKSSLMVYTKLPEPGDKYVAEILKKFDFVSVKTDSTPIETHKPLVKGPYYVCRANPICAFGILECPQFEPGKHIQIVTSTGAILEGNTTKEVSISWQETYFLGNAKSRQLWILLLQRQNMLTAAILLWASLWISNFNMLGLMGSIS
ncbi:hypothetical protein Tco_0397610 [Tanacetum coccineum]|uniref:Uncharacterized protein n=1 Tax=Tanacetum coccineum TaxID=301880 RepID=A0ABQ5DTU9_9ASTR